MNSAIKARTVQDQAETAIQPNRTPHDKNQPEYYYGRQKEGIRGTKIGENNAADKPRSANQSTPGNQRMPEAAFCDISRRREDQEECCRREKSEREHACGLRPFNEGGARAQEPVDLHQAEDSPENQERDQVREIEPECRGRKSRKAYCPSRILDRNGKSKAEEQEAAREVVIQQPHGHGHVVNEGDRQERPQTKSAKNSSIEEGGPADPACDGHRKQPTAGILERHDPTQSHCDQIRG